MKIGLNLIITTLKLTLAFLVLYGKAENHGI